MTEEVPNQRNDPMALPAHDGSSAGGVLSKGSPPTPASAVRSYENSVRIPGNVLPAESAVRYDPATMSGAHAFLLQSMPSRISARG